jgi:predicted TIM-barrel fold metal-dependent hydrolase
VDEAGVSPIRLSARSRPGSMIFTNEDVADFTCAYPKRMFGLTAVNLHDPVSAVEELEHYVKKKGFVGLRLVPWLWALPPTNPHYGPLFVNCIELDIPFLRQVGHSARACPSEVDRAVPYIDTIALTFPNLKIIRHIGYPWTAETVGVAWKHKNVYIDSSAWSPKYYAAEFVHFANTTGRKTCMFATNFPQLGFKACVDDVDRHLVKGRGLHGSRGLRRECVEDFVGANAIRVLKLPSIDLK